jgi:hypothetical protein
VELTTSPAPGEPFQFDQQVTYQVTVTDDAPVDCSTVTVGYILGHEEHGHPLSSTAGRTGTITTLVDSGHAGASNLSVVFVASSTDVPEDPNAPPLTGSDKVIPSPTPRPPISLGGVCRRPPAQLLRKAARRITAFSRRTKIVLVPHLPHDHDTPVTPDFTADPGHLVSRRHR